MASYAVAVPSANAATDRYREAEWALWRHYGLEPNERFVDLRSPAVRLRVLEVGSGEPILFVHGTVGPGAWPVLARELQGFRCLILERPGWGLSSAVDFTRYEYTTLVANLLRGALDGLGLERAHFVGGSIGNVWALRLAAQEPSRVSRVVLLGGSPLVQQVRVPGIIRLLASPIGALMARIPDKPARTRAILTHSGHGPSLAAGLIPEVFVDWRVSLARETNTMRHERDMVRTLVRGRRFAPGLTLDDAELAAIQQPTLYLFGTADPVGTVEIWRRVVGLLPRGELRLLADAGHMPWFEDPGRVAAEISSFLAGST
jgi:pimeloyl-ACP methyl ester carboxylesterase